ncbi:hypothetical protein [Marinactinospora rubrisoli]|uniref:Uncharacterized protein n=1 Tax=Marinactinospora rubrisoli TaxID=2715399 RepID=A0ABW2KPX4_9ACTN
MDDEPGEDEVWARALWAALPREDRVEIVADTLTADPVWGRWVRIMVGE